MDIREKLVELLTENCHFGQNCIGDCVGCLADHLIRHGVTVQEWIPVSEPPEAWRKENGDMVNYLIYTHEFGVDIGNYAAPAKCWVCMGLPCEPTHWALLPTPPKGE